MRTLYFENRSIVFCSPEELPSLSPGEEMSEAEGIGIFKSIYSNFTDNCSIQRLFLVNRDAETTFSQFCSCFNQINAGGGVVRNSKGQYLMIYRRNLWDLPKGKQEGNEDILECALREVKEETGLVSISPGPLICRTHHTCTFDGMFSVKHTWWFDMFHFGNELPVPQIEEEITGVKWMEREEMKEKASSSFRSIGEVIANL